MANYRKKLGSTLDIEAPCPSCGPPPLACGVSQSIPSGGTGLYNLTFDAGNTSSDIGAILVYFNPQSVPDGIRVLYDGTYYNAVSSPLAGEGRIQSISGVANAFTFLGADPHSCVPASGSFTYYDGFSNGTWDLGTPTPQSVTVNSGDDQRGGRNVYSTMVIPKINATPNEVQIQVLGPCATAWGVVVECPTALPSFLSSVVQGGTICNATSNTYYFAQGNPGTNTIPIVTNWVFSDANGQTVLPDGNYNIINNNIITVVSGVVTLIQACT